MPKLRIALGFAATFTAGMALATATQARDLAVVSWGGAYTKSQVEAYHKPFEAKTGVKINSVEVSADSRHAKMQKFTVKVKDPKDASTAHLPATFEWTDEFYYVDHMPEGLHVLLAGDLTKLDDPGKETYPGKKFGDEFPLAWRHEFNGGREWYTALGHKPEHYSDPKLAQHILGGILWAMGEKK